MASQNDAIRSSSINFLEGGKLFLYAMGYREDQLDTQKRRRAPMHWLIDGTWNWCAATTFYLKEYGIAPEPGFYRYIVSQQYRCPQPTEAVVKHADQWMWNNQG